MRMQLICAGFIAALWPTTLGTETDASGDRSTSAGIDLRVTQVLPHVAPAPPKRALPPAHRLTREAVHTVTQTAMLTAEPLTKVPIEDVCATLVAAADASGLPALFFLRLIWRESRFEQRAVSPAGALGVAQFMPDVAAERGLDHPFDPLTALWASARFLRDHYRTFGNLGLAAMAYNAGAQRVRDWLARRGKLPDETRKYVTLITGQSPEQWTTLQPLVLTLDMPKRAPCSQIAGLSEQAGTKLIYVRLEKPIRQIIETAKAEAERKAREAAEAKARKEQEKREKEAKAKKEKEKRAKKTATKKAKHKDAKDAKAKKRKEKAAKVAKANNKKMKNGKEKAKRAIATRTQAGAKAKVKQARAAKSAHKRANKKSAAGTRRHQRDRVAAN
jgi:Transglycosylase SLT domain